MRRDVDVLLFLVVIFVSIYLYVIFPGVMFCLSLFVLLYVFFVLLGEESDV
jgi:hypothetical protein